MWCSAGGKWYFLHHWLPWGKTYTVHMIPQDSEGNVLGPGYEERRQHRVCERCGKIQERVF